MQHSGNFGADDLQTMGIVSAMKSGDVRIDMLVAMCIPLIMRFLFNMMDKMGGLAGLGDWLQWWEERKNQFERKIVYKSTHNSWGGSTSLDSDTQNTVLIKAIQLYLHHNCNLSLKSAVLDLTSMDDKKMSGRGYYNSYGCDDSSGKTLVGILKKYKVIKKPPQNEWHFVGNFRSNNEDKAIFPVELFIDLREDGEDNNNNNTPKSTLTFHFRSSGEKSIDTFIDKAYDWYMKELKKLEDNSRYMYEVQISDSGSDQESNDNSSITYSRFKLSDEKTFDSLFFPQKKTLLNRINHFMSKSGTYSIQGRPHKLGLLLHGPPGTGKTSLIKAMAQYTGRSIVNVPLSKISTNTELMSVFFDKKYVIKGEDVPVKLNFKDVIFVMEDVDAASKIVKRRDGKKKDDFEQQNLENGARSPNKHLPTPKSIWTMLLESTDSTCQEVVKILMEKSERLKFEATKPQTLRRVAQRMVCVPGLGLVGEGCGAVGEACKKIEKDAIQSANDLMQNYSTVDRFVSTHAMVLKSLLDAGAEVDDVFVDSLLGCVSMPSPTKSSIVRDCSEGSFEEEKYPFQSSGDNAIQQHDFSQSTMKYGEESNDSKSEKMDSFGPLSASLWKAGKDKLNLSGLLNVLDGVVDTPERIVIMTTNHPEILDPALRRAGRIDQILHMGYMKSKDVVEMVNHYFETNLSESQRVRIERMIDGCCDGCDGCDKQERSAIEITPAQVEQLTAEYDCVEDMIQALEKKGRLAFSTCFT